MKRESKNGLVERLSSLNVGFEPTRYSEVPLENGDEEPRIRPGSALVYFRSSSPDNFFFVLVSPFSASRLLLGWDVGISGG